MQYSELSAILLNFRLNLSYQILNAYSMIDLAHAMYNLRIAAPLNHSLIPPSRPINLTTRLERPMTGSACFLKFILSSNVTPNNLSSDSQDFLFDPPGTPYLGVSCDFLEGWTCMYPNLSPLLLCTGYESIRHISPELHLASFHLPSHICQ
ncbi:hypothetical protein TRICI_003011 [Trichomonascus ciferrii]|uniref:Uncharacterized protein n=1 Tax=Trichomonascus ciferrii TaxID=44093 RepID=A0A642V567_9ASCO|nr:hypothetical protein TRICI_003011 [Trichomonascus ciferrii]